MHRLKMIFPLLLLGLPIVLLWGQSAPKEQPNRKRVGIDKRVLWTTSNVKGTPDPPLPYQTEVAFPNLRFASPLAMNVIPGTTRLAIVERLGKVFTFENKRDAKKELLLDVGKTTYGIAFHPKFKTNGYFFVTYILDPGKAQDNGTRVARFQVKKGTLKADAKSEVILLEWKSGGHNGGCLRFGPDGYLYVATGDASGIADRLLTGQDLSDLPGSILRIDVDKKADGKTYAIPEDNPFIKTGGARPEIYSYGHRQPWKFSFDRDGRLFNGEIGQDLWEAIFIIKKGGNYGWSVREGSHPFRPERRKGPTPFEKPLVEHSHNDFRSVTAGYVSYTDRLPKLRGAYVYADFDTGQVWAFRYDGKTVNDHHELTDTTYRIVAFGTDDAGEVYLVDFVGGQIHRLVKSPPPNPNAPKFPRKLSETGLFASTKDHTPAAGLIPYTVNSPLYSDNASKDRFIAIPGKGQIGFDKVTYPQPAPGAPPGWYFPDGTVLVKTFSLEMEPGNPKSKRRLETRILHHREMTGVDAEYGAQVWRGYTYVWNDEQTDAVLLDAKGLDRTFTIKDKDAPGGKRKQTWHFPSRSECTLCHTVSAKYVLGVNTLQMNRDHNYNGVTANQLDTFAHIGLFKKPLPKTSRDLPALADYQNPKADLDARARGYLHANCAHCHRKWGGGNAEFQLLATLEIEKTGTLGIKPQQGTFELSNPDLLVPGEPDRSMIYHRMTITGLGRMPHVASSVVDKDAVELIRTWIAKMPKAQSLALFNGTNLDGWHGRNGTTAGTWVAMKAVAMDKADPRKFTITPPSGVLQNGVLINGTKGRTVNLLSKAEHGDAEIHVEFMVPKGSNSGVYFQGRYEVQILDSFGVKQLKYGDCGGIYRWRKDGKYVGGKPPSVNASKAPGEWQTFDVIFRAPRFDDKGKKIENARFVKVTHNGRVIHENVEVPGPTVASSFGDEKPMGPLMIQGDHGPIAYRNIRVRHLKLK